MTNKKKILALLLACALLFVAGCTKAEEPAEPAEDRDASDDSGTGEWEVTEPKESKKFWLKKSGN